jgi:hypothetical protein
LAADPLRPIRIWLNDALKRMDPVFARMYESDAKGGRSSYRHDVVVNAQVTQASGMAERDAAAQMLADAAQVASVSITVGAEKNYDTAGSVASCHANRVTPHVAQNGGRAGGSAIDSRTTRWGLRHQPAQTQMYRAGLRLGQDGRPDSSGGVSGRELVQQLVFLTQAAYNLTAQRTLGSRTA